MAREGQPGTSMDLDSLYRDIILDHYKHPQGKTPIEDADASVEGFNPLCGDEVELCIKLSDDGGVDKARVAVQGCTICSASGSIMYELICGSSRENLDDLLSSFRAMMHGGPEAASDRAMGDLRALQGVSKFPVRIKCAMLPWTTLEEALSEARGR